MWVGKPRELDIHIHPLLLAYGNAVKKDETFYRNNNCMLFEFI